MSVRTVVRAAHYAVEPSFADAVGQLRFQRVVRAVTGTEVSAHPVLVHLAGDDVDDPAHGIRTVEHGCRAAQHLHPVGKQRLVGIGNGMPENACILRMPVNQHHQPGASSAQSAQGDASGSTAGHAVAHHATLGDEKSRYLFGQHGQERRLHALFNHGAAYHRYGLRKVAHIRLVACTGNDHFVQRIGAHTTSGVGLRHAFRAQCQCYGYCK